ncbi:hypothetical protein EK21DRAFT_109885 [Setomelanomma holmii]|uniref:Flavoprotein domain-containing protein n=1 Tax=Setomelanomma holmii TaxID=210430 RepID=A0A9P4LPS3_9PLEO|nr:hypothetical protein EK21DRAFT_109885 [Setomelanomma holmii]
MSFAHSSQRCFTALVRERGTSWVPPQRVKWWRALHTSVARRRRIVVAVAGATGAPPAFELLRRLRNLHVETRLILSTWGASTLKYELDAPNDTTKFLDSLADFTYSPRDVSTSLSSGSFLTHGMIVRHVNKQAACKPLAS